MERYNKIYSANFVSVGKGIVAISVSEIKIYKLKMHYSIYTSSQKEILFTLYFKNKIIKENGKNSVWAL